MQALVLEKPHQLRVQYAPDPVIEAPTDAIVRVTACGVCGSDLHVIEGRETGIDPNTIIGHELVGEVVEVGSAVSRLRVGDSVCSPFTTNCGACDFCEAGLPARCVAGQIYGWVERGYGLQGTHAEWVRVPHAEATLMRLPSGFDASLGILLGDNLSTGFFCAEQAGIRPDGVYVVLGCGTVGLLTICAARHLGASRVLAVDSVPWRRERAREFGATAACGIDEAPAVVAETTRGVGADAVLEAVGSPAAQLAYDLVRPGGVISSVGVPTAEHLPYPPAALYDKNMTLRVGRCPARAYMDRLAEWIADGALQVPPLVTHTLPLAEGVEAYSRFAARGPGVGKMILQP